MQVTADSLSLDHMLIYLICQSLQPIYQYLTEETRRHFTGQFTLITAWRFNLLLNSQTDTLEKFH